MTADQITTLPYDVQRCTGQLREERLDAAVNRAIEQVKEINHDNQ